MGKYSNEERNERDWYATPMKAVYPLIPYLEGVTRYAEPFVGDGKLVNHLSALKSDMTCTWAFDIEPQLDPISVIGHVQEDGTEIHDFLVSEQRDFDDMSNEDFAMGMIQRGVEAVITNPPWLNTSNSGYQLTRFCNKLCYGGFPVILLLNGNILNNKGFWQNRSHGKSIGDLCYQILPIGRLQWIEGSLFTGKEDCSWFFLNSHNTNHPRILPRK